MTEKFLLVGTYVKRGLGLLAQSSTEAYHSLDELERLVETAGGTVVEKTVQALEQVQAATFIGQGKVELLRAKALNKEFNVLVFDDELKPAQLKNLTEKIPVKILDRTRIILDIFAKRARTREGILQVELAQLSYLLPRMTERYGQFEQQVGGIGTRGPGERKLEVEARHVRERTASLRKQILQIGVQRQVARDRRHKVPLPVITLVGYTNAGKSTLLNTLVSHFGQSQEKVYADDKLFATLDPTTRRIRLPRSRWALFTDTVGFIHKLPTHLVAAFRSTLEETLDADILLHLIDVTDAKWQDHFQTVIEILHSLDKNANHKNKKSSSFLQRMMMVYNKTDLLSKKDQENLRHSHAQLLNAMEKIAGLEKIELPPQITFGMNVSAKTGTGINALLETIETRLSETMLEKVIDIPFTKMRVLPMVYRLGQVQKSEHKKNFLRVTLHLEKSHWQQLEKILNA